MRNKLMILALLLWAGLTQAQTEPSGSNGKVRYVSDDLYTFLHTGPGRNYRILGSVQSGTKLTLLQMNTEKNFAQVIDDKERTGWVDGAHIMVTESLKLQLPKVQNRLQEATESLQRQQKTNDLLNQQIADLTSQNNQLKRQVEKVGKENQAYSDELASRDKTEQMEWFTRGGIVALIGIIVGVIIAYLPKGRKRREQWM